MSDYCTSTDVRDRLTAAGFRFSVDRDRDDEESASEVASYVTTAIVYAGNIIDAALTPTIPPADARAQSNAWLKDRAIDIAVYRVATHGGRKCPQHLRSDYERTIDWITKIEDGDLSVPGLTYPQAINGDRPAVPGPRAVNVTPHRRRFRPGGRY